MASILLDPLRLVLTIYSILSQFLDFHQFAIFLQNDVIMQQLFQLHPCHAMPCHHICHIIIHAMPCHHIFHIIIHAMSSLPLFFTEFFLPLYPWLFLCYFFVIIPLTSMMIHVMDPLYFTHFILLPCLLVIPLSFVNTFWINENDIFSTISPFGIDGNI